MAWYFSRVGTPLRDDFLGEDQRADAAWRTAAIMAFSFIGWLSTIIAQVPEVLHVRVRGEGFWAAQCLDDGVSGGKRRVHRGIRSLPLDLRCPALWHGVVEFVIVRSFMAVPLITRLAG